MPLAQPPLLENLLFEQPWPLVVAMVAVAAGCWVVASRRQKRGRLRLIALGIIVLAGAVVAMAQLVTTDREYLLDATAELVAATQSPTNSQVLDQLIAADAVVTGPAGEVWLEYAQLRSELQSVVDRHQIQEQRIRSVGAEVTSKTAGRSVFDLRTNIGKETFIPIRSVWALRWVRDDAGQWRIKEIQWLQFQGHTPTQGLWKH